MEKEQKTVITGIRVGFLGRITEQLKTGSNRIAFGHRIKNKVYFSHKT